MCLQMTAESDQLFQKWTDIERSAEEVLTAKQEIVDLDRKSRSEIAERCIRLIKGLNDTPLDISHYNALLKVKNLKRERL